MALLAKGCDHLREFKQANNGLHSYQIIYKYLVKPQSVNTEARKLKVCYYVKYTMRGVDLKMVVV